MIMGNSLTDCVMENGSRLLILLSLSFLLFFTDLRFLSSIQLLPFCLIPSSVRIFQQRNETYTLDCWNEEKVEYIRYSFIPNATAMQIQLLLLAVVRYNPDITRFITYFVKKTKFLLFPSTRAYI